VSAGGEDSSIPSPLANASGAPLPLPSPHLCSSCGACVSIPRRQDGVVGHCSPDLLYPAPLHFLNRPTQPFSQVMWDVWTSGFRGDSIEPSPSVTPTLVAADAADEPGGAAHERGRVADEARRRADEIGGGADRADGEGAREGAASSDVRRDEDLGDGVGSGGGVGNDARVPGSGEAPSRHSLSWHTYCWWAPNVTPRLTWLCAAYHRHLFAIQVRHNTPRCAYSTHIAGVSMLLSA
jgi:hypothetical protein